MKRFLFAAGVPVLALSGIASEIPSPREIVNSNAYYISPNTSYMVSDGYVGLQIFDLASGSSYDYTDGSPDGHYEASNGRCISNNGIVLSLNAAYWMDGVWHRIKVPSSARYINLINSITPDGRRICGSIGMSGIAADNEDRMRQAPCIWNWDPELGDFSEPVMLPFPARDYSDRVPQMVTAIDISEDGKTVVGQVVTAVGIIKYPIVYREDESGEWSYEIPDRDALYPDGFLFPEFPGDEGPVMPQQEQFMTPGELAEYLDAYDEYVNSGYTVTEPRYEEFMTASEIEAYHKAMAEYEFDNEVWSTKFMAWLRAYYRIGESIPGFQFNSIRISPDGKTYACTIENEDVVDDLGTIKKYSFVYVFDLASGHITRYEQKDNFILTYLANDGAALAVTDLAGVSQSYVLKGGECVPMRNWITSRIPQYDSWIDDNMTEGVDVTVFDEELGEDIIVYDEVVLTGRACATPDLSVITLGVTNVWDYADEGNSFVFDMRYADGVSSVVSDGAGKVIFDLYGRKLGSADAPGIYIINGEKKMIR